MYADVSRAYFYAKAVRPVYVVLPPEDRNVGDDNMVGELVMSMYGTRDAALHWSTEYSDTLIESGYIQGKSNGCLFHHPQKGVSILVHGDDFVAVGDDDGLAEARATLENNHAGLDARQLVARSARSALCCSRIERSVACHSRRAAALGSHRC